MNWPQQEGRTADPIGQGRAVKLNALAGADLSLPVERQMIGIFANEHLRDCRLRRRSALDQARRRRRLHHHVLASPAAIFGPANDEHAELRRHDIEPLAGILADPVQRLTAARASAVFDIDHHLDARQMLGKRPAVDAALCGSACALGRIGRITLGLLARCSLLDVFKPEQHLIFGQCLGAPAKAMALQFLDDLTQPLVLHPLGNQHRLQRAGIVGKRIRQNGHGGIRSCVTRRSERFSPADSPCRSHAGCIGAAVSRAA